MRLFFYKFIDSMENRDSTMELNSDESILDVMVTERSISDDYINGKLNYNLFYMCLFYVAHMCL